MKNISNIEISIITATFNSAKTVSDCISSINMQTHKNIEHIIIDGGSKDNTIEIIKTMSNQVVKTISEPDKGIYDALNKGIKMATGDVIGFVHSDDLLANPNALQNIARAFSFPSPNNKTSLSFPLTGGNVCVRNEGGRQRGSKNTKAANEEPDGVYGNLIFIDSTDTNKTVRTWISKPFNRKNVNHGWMPPHPTLFLKKEVYEKHGLFDTSFKTAGDYDFMLRLMLDKEIKLICIPEVITKMRMGGVSTGNIKQLILKSKEDIRALKNNGFSFPIFVLLAKNFRKLPQLLKR